MSNNENKKNTSEETIESLISQAISEIPNLKTGEKFMVRDLFIGYEWNRLSNYVRAQVGHGFYYQYAVLNDISQVNVLDKTARNQQIYSKI